MTFIANIFVAVLSVLHAGFFILEFFLWTKPLGRRIFAQSQERAKSSAVLAANQGVYNLFLTAGLAWGLIHPAEAVAFQIKLFFLGCVIIAGAYGGYSVSKKIFLVQGLPALMALGALFLSR